MVKAFKCQIKEKNKRRYSINLSSDGGFNSNMKSGLQSHILSSYLNSSFIPDEILRFKIEMSDRPSMKITETLQNILNYFNSFMFFVRFFEK